MPSRRCHTRCHVNRPARGRTVRSRGSVTWNVSTRFTGELLDLLGGRREARTRDLRVANANQGRNQARFYLNQATVTSSATIITDAVGRRSSGDSSCTPDAARRSCPAGRPRSSVRARCTHSHRGTATPDRLGAAEPAAAARSRRDAPHSRVASRGQVPAWRHQMNCARAPMVASLVCQARIA